MESRWVNVDGIPAVEVIWWAGGVKVTERITALAGAEALLESIQLDGAGLAGDDSRKHQALLAARANPRERIGACSE